MFSLTNYHWTTINGMGSPVYFGDAYMYTGASHKHASLTPMRSGIICDNITIFGADEMEYLKGSLTQLRYLSCIRYK